MANINKLLRQWQTVSTLTRDCLLATAYIDLYDKQITVDNFIKQFFSLLVAADYNGSELEKSIKNVVFGGALVPGATMLWPHTSLPDGYLKMDGSAVSRSTYSDLYEALGIYYGGGDGFNTFNIPNVSGYFIRFVDDGAAVDPDAGTRTPANGGTSEESGSVQDYATGEPVSDFTLTNDENHSHPWPKIGTDGGSVNDKLDSTGDTGSWLPSISLSTDPDHTHTVESANSETRPYNVYLTGIIKY